MQILLVEDDIAELVATQLPAAFKLIAKSDYNLLFIRVLHFDF
jgi:hypothetical protein